jgi:hypothetical protein
MTDSPKEAAITDKAARDLLEVEKLRAVNAMLLEALQEVKSVFDSNPASIVDAVWTVSYPSITLYDHCHAAIVKATGEQA